jgi:hypothetical protein
VFTGAGVITRGTEFTVTRTGPGVYILQLQGLKGLISAEVTNNSGAAYIGTCAVQTDGSLNIWGWNNAGSLIDPTSMAFTVIGIPR